MNNKTYKRIDGRAIDELRPILMEKNISRYAEGSCLIKQGNTHILCTATVEDNVPPFLRHSGKGWLTCEYGMLPRATHNRIDRKKMIDDGRIKEIQRLIGRSLRACLDFKKLGERQIRIDCDVLQADGGTRTASITGGYVALALAVKYMQDIELITTQPLIHHIAAVSCGIVGGVPLLDLQYEEDSNADADANFVLTDDGNIVEIQASSEKKLFSHDEYQQLYQLAHHGIKNLISEQKDILLSS